ncbi:MAG TPA: hypothetical protein VFW25_05685 [Silvibacterium sp.]|nr:hypothetical protein [Silvibacterium sp.]
MKQFCLAAIFAFLLCLPAMSVAQGCSLCRDTTAGSAPKAREGLRRGILVLGVPAAAIFVGILAVGWKIKPRED